MLNSVQRGVGEPLQFYREEAHIKGDWTYLHPFLLLEVVDPNRYLSDLVKGRRIVHVGCAAEGATRQQFENGKLLFALFEDCAAAQLGIDPDEQGMKELAELITPGWDLQTCRLEDVDRELLNRFQPEVILLPEVIEHIPDAGLLLSQVKEIAKRYEAEIAVTVPNALSMTAIRSWVDGFEYVHPDHVAGYTPRTLQTLFEKCGLRPLEIRPYSWGPPPHPITTNDTLRLFLSATGGLREDY